MQFKNSIFSAIALLTVAAAAAPSPIGTTNDVALAPNIATDPYFACNCPNNCSHDVGSSCEYYQGPSDNSNTVKGRCVYGSGGGLTCVV